MVSRAYIFPVLSERGKRLFFGDKSMVVEQLKDFNTWITIVCERLGVNIVDFKGKRRYKHLVEARQLACWMYNEYCLYNKVHRISLAEMGKMIGGKDHATVLHSINVIEVAVLTYTDKRHKYWGMYNQIVFDYL